MLRTITILVGAIATAVVMFQVAINAATDIHYWKVGSEDPSALLWCGVIAAGLLLGGTILMLHRPRAAALAYGAAVPLLALYEVEFASNYLSLAVSRSIGAWLVAGALVLTVLAALCPKVDRADKAALGD